MRRRPCPQAFQQKAEALLRLLLRNPQQGKHPALERGVGDPETPSPQLGSIQYHVVRQGPDPFRRRIEQGQIVGMRCGEGVIHRIQRSAPGGSLEEGKVDDPDESILALVDETLARSYLTSHPTERGAGDMIRSCNQQREVTIPQTQT